MDISSSSKGVKGRLSNFTPRVFELDGIECNSMEGLLQAFKFENTQSQIQTCKLAGIAAKRKGSKRNKYWQNKQTLWWNGESYPRKSKEYQELLTRAFDALGENENFKSDLLSTGDAVFTHSIGKRKQENTVLTTSEFCGQLTRLREKFKEEN